MICFRHWRRIVASSRALYVLPAVAIASLTAGEAQAYIGPGAGFALGGSMLVLLATFLLAFAIILTYPFRMLYRFIKVGNPYKTAIAKKVVILGLDGMDPGLTTRFMREGRMPNFQKLADRGVFRKLDTSNPSMSPVAWSTFATGVDASRHNIYDFLTRDPCTYGPTLSSTELTEVRKVVNIGPFMVPLGGTKAKMKLLQKSQHFWKLLGERNIFSVIQRVPITFPPEPFKNGLLLSGMCVPDLRGSQGTFSFFSSDSDGGEAKFIAGEQTVLRPKGNVTRSRIVGPDNPKGGRMTLPFTLTVSEDGTAALLDIDGGESINLVVNEYSDWIELKFSAGFGASAAGIARFYLISTAPHINLYMTPIHIDPENPSMPISHPEVYAIYLAKRQGKFATMGFSEDTWALNGRVIDEQVFLDQAMSIYDERETMFLDAVQQAKKGLVTTVFDTTDRIQHMFYRYLDPTHPANEGKDTVKHQDAIAAVYQKADELIGKLQPVIDDPDAVLMVISDHGFTNFRRCININSWLRENGYLFMQDESATESGEWFEGVDWTRTKAFALGLTGIFINRRGREKSGIVHEGKDYRDLCKEIAEKLENMIDPATGKRCCRRVAVSHSYFDGPYRFDAPDLLVGWDGGYRYSWEGAVGQVMPEVFSDNTRSWSGDHCVDPDVVPGILFCDRALSEANPRLVDIPATVLKLFGQQIPGYMQGHMILPEAGEQGTVKGMIDPTSLEQSGSAPGALIFPPEDRKASGQS